ncbi:MAG TPA: FAD-binding oxidoreductase [Azospirillaceae bacterium]|nr:FAD-binding oxidoreductase [Azospirillaceae bacterium]
MRDGHWDVVIVGGGVIGSAIAYFLLCDPAFKGAVAVVERDPSYRTASSALSASSIRQQFSTPTNIAMSRFGIGFLRDLQTHLSVEGDVPDIGLRTPGYLFLASPRGEDVMRRNHATQVAEGVPVALLSPDALTARFPWMSAEGLALASLGLADEGWFDGYGLLQAFRRKARALGAVYIEAEVTGLEAASRGRIEAVRLSDGRRLACGAVVNAAGPHARRVAAMAGVPLPVEARKRCVFVFDCRVPLPGCPLVIDPSGVWFRPEGAAFIAGAPPPADPEDADLTVDHGLWEEILWPALATRVPAFEAVKVTGAWAGHYEYNTVDHNAILGPHPEIANFLFANGFSGHGLQQSPAVGRGIAELLVHGAYRTLDLSVFGYDRLAAGRRIVELNVV